MIIFRNKAEGRIEKKSPRAAYFEPIGTMEKADKFLSA